MRHGPTHYLSLLGRLALLLLVGRDYLGLSTQLLADAFAGHHIECWAVETVGQDDP